MSRYVGLTSYHQLLKRTRFIPVVDYRFISKRNQSHWRVAVRVRRPQVTKVDSLCSTVSLTISGMRRGRSYSRTVVSWMPAVGGQSMVDSRAAQRQSITLIRYFRGSLLQRLPAKERAGQRLTRSTRREGTIGGQPSRKSRRLK